MSFLNKDVTVQLIDLLKLVVVSLGAGSLAYMLYPDIGWILITTTVLILALWLIEFYHHLTGA